MLVLVLCPQAVDIRDHNSNNNTVVPHMFKQDVYYVPCPLSNIAYTQVRSPLVTRSVQM